ncbi:unnamed protein product (macronuclear) [Paramecium tetraurelia]|uniref:Cyclic nucleotide-binding domain-containing protein n=1 Tax=Paramecium tetraurelia TaxID=5888 RepID=A0BKG1_PARTE|nr:uncharacterized protein GSPATT00029659001 [Paramecium tetraurelia]CAK59028.1 unnamed protein product [Paramecium tetraurelia]|eukprot:XP_001426426.1 hypothetical protein (macronuclear) [Paramecium tetraurelia strain d4-2]
MNQKNTIAPGVEAKLLSEQSESGLYSAKINSSKQIFQKQPPFYADIYFFQTNGKKPFNYEKKNDYVKKFTDNLLDPVRKTKKIRNFHLSLIGDKGSSDEIFSQRKSSTLSQLNQKQLRFFQKLQETFIFQLEKLPLIHPSQYIKMIWDIVAVTARLYFLYIIPIDLAWVQQQFIFRDFKYISILFLLILIFDLLISLNTVYFSNGEAVTSRIQIVKQMFQLLIYFITDRFVNISLDVENNVINVGLLIFLVHHKTIINYATNYEEGLNISKKTSSFVALFKLIAFLFYVIHLFSCFWFWVTLIIENYDGKSWIMATNMYEQKWNIQYLQAFYYTAVTMFTVGYGDVTPQSSLEKIVSIVLIMISSIQLPYSVNTVGNIIKEISAFSEERKRKLRIINSYMNKSSMSLGLKMKIRQYLTYYWENKVISQSEEEKEIIDSLSEFLRQQLIGEAHQKIFDQCTLFKIPFSDQFKRQLIKEVEEVLLTPEQDLKSTNDILLYYIEDGSIQICLQEGRKINLGIVNKGASIGIKNFIMGTESLESYKSVGFTKAMILKRRNFLKILQEHPEDQELFCAVRDKMIFYQDDQYFTVTCFSCGKQSHKLIECPLIKFVPNKEFIIKKHLYPQQQCRNPLDRGRKKVNSLILNKKRLEQCALLIQKDEPMLFQLYRFDHMYNIDEDQQLKRNIKQTTSFQNINHHHQQNKRERYFSIQDQTQKLIKKKFQRLVNKLISINKVYPYFLIQTYVQYEKQIEQRQVSMTLQILEQRCKNISQIASKQFDKYQIDMSLIIQKLSNKQYIDDLEFESPKAYKFYFRKDNFSIVKQKNFLENLNILKKFIQYFQYPGDIIKQFNLSSVGFFLLMNKRKPVVCFSADNVVK